MSFSLEHMLPGFWMRSLPGGFKSAGTLNVRPGKRVLHEYWPSCLWVAQRAISRQGVGVSTPVIGVRVSRKRRSGRLPPGCRTFQEQAGGGLSANAAARCASRGEHPTGVSLILCQVIGDAEKPLALAGPPGILKGTMPGRTL